MCLKSLEDFDNDNSIDNKGFIDLVVSMYSTNLLIIRYDSINNQMNILNEIEEACNNKKPGISTIDNILFKKDIIEDELFILDEEEIIEYNSGKYILNINKINIINY